MSNVLEEPTTVGADPSPWLAMRKQNCPLNLLPVWLYFSLTLNKPITCHKGQSCFLVVWLNWLQTVGPSINLNLGDRLKTQYWTHSFVMNPKFYGNSDLGNNKISIKHHGKKLVGMWYSWQGIISEWKMFAKYKHCKVMYHQDFINRFSGIFI